MKLYPALAILVSMITPMAFALRGSWEKNTEPEESVRSHISCFLLQNKALIIFALYFVARLHGQRHSNNIVMVLL